MKKKLAFLSACLLTMACSSEQYTNDAPERGDGVTVRLSASGGSYELTEGGKTRAADGLYTSETGFSGGETVKVYKMVGSDTESADYSVGAPDNGTSALTAVGDDLRYPTEGTTTLYAVYPSTSTESHVVKYDQKTDAAYKASDLMFAPAVTVIQAQQNDDQELTFNHQLVKLRVVINKAAEVGQVTGVTLKNVKRKAAVTVASTGMTVGEATATTSGDDGYSATAATNNSILVSGEEAAAPGVAETYTYSCVFPAQAWAEADFITIAADTKTTTYKLTKSFTAGNFYELTVTLNGLALGSTVTIDNWGALDGFCTVNPTAPGGGTLKFSDIADVTYNGSAFEPAVTVKNAQNETLTPGTDYTLQYFSNTNAGQAIVFATGQGTYEGQIGFTGFNILKAAGSISYAPASVTKTYGDADFLNTATLSPNAGTGLGTVTYASSDPTVAMIDASTGSMHILKAGSTTVTATVADGMNFEYATNTATCEVTVNKAAGFVTLSATSGSVGEGEETTFTVATNHGGDLSVSTSDATKATATISGTTVTVTGTAIGSATITVTCAATDGYEAATATYTATVASGASGNWVDLGLSVLWANANVGAENPGDYGLFFAWGSTIGSTTSRFSVAPATSPVNPSTLPAAYDAATSSAQSDYTDGRMPTAAELTELMNTKSNTTDYSWQWTTLDSHNGWKITRQTGDCAGNWIFLPAAGCRENTSTSYQGSFGFYWSSSINSSITGFAQYLFFDSGSVNMQSYNRQFGLSVRAVKNKN